MTTHAIYKSSSVTSTLRAQKRRPHGRQGNVRRCWKLRHVTVVHPGAFGSDAAGSTLVGPLKTVRR